MAARKIRLAHPGKILREESMAPVGLSAYALAYWWSDGDVYRNSRPSGDASACNCAAFVGFPASAPTTTSSTSRRIRMGIAGSGDVEFPSNLRSYRWG